MGYVEVFDKICLEHHVLDGEAVFRFGPDTVFHENPIRSMNANPSPHILPMELSWVNNIAILKYTINHPMRVSDFLKNTVTEGDFYKILLQIFQGILEADNYYANENSFVLDPDYIYIDPTQLRVSMMYMPVDFPIQIHEMLEGFLVSLLKNEDTFPWKNEEAYLALKTKKGLKIKEMYAWVYSRMNTYQRVETQGPEIQKRTAYETNVGGKNEGPKLSPLPSSKREEERDENRVASTTSRGLRVPVAIPNAKSKKTQEIQKEKGKEKDGKEKVDMSNFITHFVVRQFRKMKGQSRKEETKIPQNASSIGRDEIGIKEGTPQKEVIKEVPPHKEAEKERPPHKGEVQKKPIPEWLLRKDAIQEEGIVHREEEPRRANEKEGEEHAKEGEEHAKEVEEHAKEGQRILAKTQFLNEEHAILAHAKLVHMSRDKEQETDLTRALLKMGRDPEKNDLVLDDIKVSKEHAHLFQKYEIFYIIDRGSDGEGSTNGVFINGKRIEKVKPVLLNHGDEIVIGRNRFLFLKEATK
jgi:hypothetical protein